MSTQSPNVQDDLAFMKSLVADGGRFQMSGGWAFVAGGIFYGVQCLLYYAQFQGAPLSDAFMFWVTVGSNLGFFAVLGWAIWLDSKQGPRGMVGRAINAMFAATGLANLAMVIVFSVNATKNEDINLWLLYPIVVCALQGAAWFTAYLLRKHIWLLGVALGWYATAVALGFVVGQPAYVLILGIALLLLMALPGYALVRLAKKHG